MSYPSAKAVILGAGVVGRALARQIVKRTKGRVEVLALCDSTGAFVSQDLARGTPLSSEKVLQACEYKENGNSLEGAPQGHGKKLNSLELVMGCPETRDESKSGVTIVVDASASLDTLPALKLAVARGFRVCSANKKPFADAPQAVFDELTRWPGSCRFESSAGACTPFVAAVQRLKDAGDEVRVWRGTMSGTLGFISTGLRDGAPFSKVLRDAIDGGYTEPDCREDLSGMDVARKAVILHRVLGFRAELADLEVRALFPERLRGVPYEEFLGRVCDGGELDQEMAAMAEGARERGCALQYVASRSVGGPLEVAMSPVPLDSPLGQLRGTANMLQLDTEHFSESPLVIQGCGAGGDPTASGMLADMVALAHTAPPPR